MFFKIKLYKTFKLSFSKTENKPERRDKNQTQTFISPTKKLALRKNKKIKH